MLVKARALAVDEVVIDLEDSVAPPVKAQARAAVTAAVAQEDWGERAVAVRINGPATPWCHRDVIDVVAGSGEGLTSLVVPKVESPGEIEFVDRLAGMVEQEVGRAASVGLQALIETATGLRHIHAIAHASTRLETLIVGYADLSASLGLSTEAAYPGDRWHHVLSTVLIAARDAGTFEQVRTASCEVGLHGIKHDGKLFSGRASFEADLPLIHRYLEEWSAVGFRSPATTATQTGCPSSAACTTARSLTPIPSNPRPAAAARSSPSSSGTSLSCRSPSFRTTRCGRSCATMRWTSRCRRRRGSCATTGWSMCSSILTTC